MRAWAATERCLARFRDPEPVYYMARQLTRLGEFERAVNELHRVLDQGYVCARALVNDPWLAALRSHAEYEGLLRRATELEGNMTKVFEQSGLARLLGVSGGP